MKGYTRKVGLRKPKRRVPIGLFQVLSDEQAAQVREHGHLVGYRRVQSAPVMSSDEFARNWHAPLPPDDPIGEECDSIDPSACVVHGDPGGWLGRDEPTCPHCPCTQTTECCYCDGTRTPLEDS